MPFGGALTLGAIGLASAGSKYLASRKQAQQARELTIDDSTPAAFKQKAALDQQAAVSGTLPGMAQQQDRLAQVQAGAVQNARLGAGSGSDFLAAAGAADARRASGEQALATQGLQYQDAARRTVGANLTTQAGYQQNDYNQFQAKKGALIQASAQNQQGAIDTLGSYAMAAVGGGMGAGMGGGRTPSMPGVTPQLNMSQGVSQDYNGPPDLLPDSNGYTPYSPGMGMGVQGLRRSRYANSYGI